MDHATTLRQIAGSATDFSSVLANPKHLRAAADELDRLKKIEVAARDIENTITGGFVVCQKCGDQEDLTNIDFADDLRAALKHE